MALLAGLAAGCRAGGEGAPPSAAWPGAGRALHGPLVHVVLVALAEPSDGAALVRQARERLGGIPSVAGLQVGPPVDVGRAGVDLAFDVAIVVSFDDVDGYRAYLEHPEHLALVADWKPRSTGMRIHDLVAGPLPGPATPESAADGEPGTDAAR